MSDFNFGEGRFPVYTDWLICIHFFSFLQRQRAPLQTQSLLSLPGEYARMQWRDRFARFCSRAWCFHVDFRTMICFFSPSLQRFHFCTMKGFRNCVIAYLVPFRNRPAVLSGFSDGAITPLLFWCASAKIKGFVPRFLVACIIMDKFSAFCSSPGI